MPKISDATLVQQIHSALSDIQDRAVQLKLSGRTEDQSVAPTVFVSYQELRHLTGRTKIKVAFINNLTALLLDAGLEVEEGHDELTITLPAADIDTDFDSLRVLFKTQKDMAITR